MRPTAPLIALLMTACGGKPSEDDSAQASDSDATEESRADDSATDDSDADDSDADDSATDDSATDDSPTDDSPTDVDADGDGAPASVDCDDDDPSVHPGAQEVCSGVDDDCDGLVDDADGSLDRTTAPRWFLDADADGFGLSSASVQACELPPGHAERAGDCDDRRADVNPSAQEVCDADDVDEDCDGAADDADTSVDTSTMSDWYDDSDRDGYGDDSTVQAACDALSNQVSVGGDCDDGDSRVNPGAFERCDSADTDEDCDGLSDDDDPSAITASMNTSWQDSDGDGYGDPNTAALYCDPPSSWSSNDDDCDDADASVSPSASEACGDGVDNDCSGLLDCEEAACLSDATCVESDCSDGLDNEGDGYADCYDDDCWGGGCDVEAVATLRGIGSAGTRHQVSYSAYDFRTFSQGYSQLTSTTTTRDLLIAANVSGSVRWAAASGSATCAWSLDRVELSAWTRTRLRQRRLNSSVISGSSSQSSGVTATRQGLQLDSACPFTLQAASFLPQAFDVDIHGVDLINGDAWYAGTAVSTTFFSTIYGSTIRESDGRGSRVWGWVFTDYELTNPSVGAASYVTSW